jgi:hypothetical protein
MRLVMTAAALAALALPVTSHAEARLQLAAFDGGPARPASLHVDVPRLRLGAGDLRADDGSGAGQGVEPALAAVLGFFPGFGLGHYVAGSPKWQTWLVIDLLVLGGAILVSALDAGVLEALAWIAVVVEHGIEAIDAFRVAGGKGLGAAPGAREALALDSELRAPARYRAGASAGPAVAMLRF